MDGKNAKRSDDITPEMWATVNPENREMVEEYLANQAELAIKTKVSYESALKIFFYWVKENLKDKSYLEIKKKEFARYLNWLTNRGLSDSAIRMKKSSVSAFCNYIFRKMSYIFKHYACICAYNFIIYYILGQYKTKKNE